jgi:ribosomal protein L4
MKSFRNIGSVECDSVANLNPVSVLKHKFLVIENPEAALKIVEKRLTGRGAAQPARSEKDSK